MSNSSLSSPCSSPRLSRVSYPAGGFSALRLGLAVVVLAGTACSSSDGGGGTPGSGGANSGGTSGPSSGGASGTGGRVDATGGSTGSSGGAIGTGGDASGSGGATSGSGGATSGSGGRAGTGGSPGSGGAAGGSSQGGSTGSAGAPGTGGGSAGGAVAVAPCTTNEVSTCKGTSPVECHFGGSPGNYEVTVELGGAAAGDTYVDAESFRRMISQTKTAAGATTRFSFITNVRSYENEPVRPDDSASDEFTTGIAGLDIYFRGPTPKVTSICKKVAATRPLMLWIAGDSTVTDQQSEGYAGWGQHLPQHFLPPISVANYADSGESSASFLRNTRLWGAIKGGWKAGDWVLIQLGHNDKTISAADFKTNMTTMVTDAKAASVNVVLVTPIARQGYTLAEEHVNQMNANLPQIIRDLGKSQNVPVIDLTVTTWNWLQTIASSWQDYFAKDDTGASDHTHTNHKGADVISFFVHDAVKAQLPELAKYLRVP